eukprot:1963713-Pyramimonas_sp.AAC.6
MSIFVRHVATVPANCSISLTSEDEYVEAALPWNSSISFPSETGEILVPGGSSLIMPQSDKLLRVTLAPGTEIAPPNVDVENVKEQLRVATHIDCYIATLVCDQYGIKSDGLSLPTEAVLTFPLIG